LLQNATYCTEIASNGYGSENLTQYTESQQSVYISNATASIDEYTGILPTTLIPPYNTFNTNTTAALLALDYTIISASAITDAGFYTNTAPIYHYPSDAFTTNPGSTPYIAYTSDIVYAAIQSQLSADGFSVVTMQPQEFSELSGTTYGPDVNTTAFAYLQELIALIKNNTSLKFVTINQLPECVSGVFPLTCVHGRGTPSAITGTANITGSQITGSHITGSMNATTGSVNITGSQITGSHITGSTTGQVNMTGHVNITGSQITGIELTTDGNPNIQVQKSSAGMFSPSIMFILFALLFVGNYF